ncbi:MAG: BlaI/MecI/CopY family transcriptional regulator [Ruminococcaceae bacterium]|nr:BlaI/MecI/CopY family transcriptional regulator [Oscillospiraceae bacterium]
MDENKMTLAPVESKFADIIWEHEPIGSGALVKLASEKLNWKKSTTYTVLKKLCDRKIFINDESVVRSLISREDFYALQSEMFVDETFEGSLPLFLAAFSRRKKLSEKEIDELYKLLESAKNK